MSRLRRRRGTAATVVAVVLATVLSTAAATARPTNHLTAARGPSVSLHAVDGGADYTRRFDRSLPASPSFFPIGVWLESVTDPSDVATDQAAGLNTYVQLTDDSDLSLLRGTGMHVISANPRAPVRSPVAGWFISDEADMNYGPGWSPVVGADNHQKCARGGKRCGYTFLRALRAQLPDDHRLRYANYGKGVTFWESDDEARVFVNRFQDIVSADNYWFTDPNICQASEGGTLLGDRELSPEKCRRAANYGATIDRVRSLVRPAGSKPVWALVELGHPFIEEHAPTIQPAEVRAAVWSSLIHGARGVMYFNHSFAGACPTYHALREPCYEDVRSMVTNINRQITELAPVLNAPTATGVTRTHGDVDVMTKWSGDTYYVFAGSTAAHEQRVTFDLACTGDAVATVLGEQRTVPVTGGRFTDTFADGNAVHLYRIDGDTTCVPD